MSLQHTQDWLKRGQRRVMGEIMAITITSQYSKQQIIAIVQQASHKMSYFSFNEGLCYKFKGNTIFLKVRKALLNHPFQRVLKLGIVEESQGTILKGKFVFPVISFIVFAACILFFMYEIIDTIINCTIWRDSVERVCWFLLFCLFYAGIIISGKLLYKNEEKQATDFIKSLGK